MPQSTAEILEAQIRNNRLLDFSVDWSDELIFPYYDGLCLRNIPHTISDILAAPLAHNTPLLPDVWQEPVPQANRVVVFLMDGMGYKHLHMLMENDTEIRQAVDELSGGREVIPLTSVAPSTTAVALTTLWTGATPAKSGITGTLMFLREISVLVNMLNFSPVFGRHPQDAIENWGLPPENLLKTTGLSQHLHNHNIPTYIVTKKMYLGTGLSRIMHSGTERVVAHKGHSDMMLCVEDVMQETRGEKCYIGIYWDAVDALAHEHGAHSKYTHAEIRRQLLALRDLLKQPNISDGQTLFMLLADHGHYDALEPIDLAQDELINNALQMSLSGDERHAYAYLRHGTLESVIERIDTQYPDTLTYMKTSDAIEYGYFGHQLNGAIYHRAGDLILIPRLGKIVRDPILGNIDMISRHAGLSDWEMLIPFIWRLL